MTPADLPALYEELREAVHPETMGRVVRVESGGHVFAVNVNRRPGQSAPPAIRQPRTLDEAVALALHWIGQGHTVDIGLGQVNSIHLATMGLTVRQLFDPRTNLRASASVLQACYARARRAGLEHGGREAMTAMLSCYNTGDMQRGIQNGYVSRYGMVPALAQPIPAQARVSRPRVVDPREAVAVAPPEWHAAVAMTTGGLP